MFVGRLLGWLLLVAAVILAGSEAVHSLAAGHWTPRSLDEFWSALDPGGPGQVAAFVRDRLWPPLWDSGLAVVLGGPAWAVSGGLGLIFLALFRPRPPKRKRSFSRSA
jgi:hypothetical protein